MSLPSTILASWDTAITCLYVFLPCAANLVICFPCGNTVLQDIEPGDIDLKDALQLLAAKLEAQDKKYGSKQTADSKLGAKSEEHIGSSSDGSSSDDGLQSSDSSSKAPAARTAALRAARTGTKASGSRAKATAKQKLGKVGTSGEASSTGKVKSIGKTKPNGKAKLTGNVQSVGAASKSNLGSKGQSAKENKNTGKGKNGSAAEATPKSGYRAFWKEQWDKLKADNPSIKMTDATKHISSVWKHLDAEGREKYKG